jgi:glycosyltransferase involved in cell wall biosynthesis
MDKYNMLKEKLNSASEHELFNLYNELIVAAYRCNKEQESKELCQKLLNLAKFNPIIEQQLTQNFDYVKYNFSQFNETNNISLCIVCGRRSLVGNWSPETIRTGLTGSEEAVVNVSLILSKYFQVNVYAQPQQTSLYTLPLSNPRYFQAEELKIKSKHDVSIAWRHYAFDNLKKISDKVLFWPHDICNSKFSSNNLDGILWLSEAQKTQFCDINPELKNIPSIICGNGLDLTHFENLNCHKENIYSCIYASNYGRGLVILLNIWNEIHDNFPEATLDIYYGWEHWGLLTEQQVTSMKDKIKELESKGVKEHGKIGHIELAERMAKTSLWTYPCTAFETFCITAIKAQAAECIPVVISKSALKETVNPHAFITEILDEENYKELLLNAMRNLKNKDRNIFREFGRLCTWNRVCENINNFIESI